MFLTVFGQKGGVAKTCTSIHLGCVWAQQGLSVCVVDADRNRSATAYAARGMLPFEVVPVEAAAKNTRHIEMIITDGQASSHEEELKNLGNLAQGRLCNLNNGLISSEERAETIADYLERVQ